jgi:hypothetical protein
MSWIRWLVVDLSPRRLDFDLGPAPIGFMVGRVASSIYHRRYKIIATDSVLQ